MKLRKLKGFVVGLVCGAVLMCAGQVFAQMQSIDVFFNNIKILVNGNEIKADSQPFIYNGRTYVPIRFVAEALGMEVKWNETKNQAEITSIQSLPSPSPNQSPSPVLTPTPSPVVTVSPCPSSVPSQTPQNTLSVFNNTQEIKNYLTLNYSTLDTCIGTTNFTFEVNENKYTFMPFDYWIMADFDFKYFSDAIYSLNYTTEQKNTLKQQLQNHMQILANDIILKMPNKKFEGGYYKSWYRYPTIKQDLIVRRAYSWANFSPIIGSYDSSKITQFYWTPNLDNELD